MKTLAHLKPARMTIFRACRGLCWAFGGLVDVYLVFVEALVQVHVVGHAHVGIPFCLRLLRGSAQNPFVVGPGATGSWLRRRWEAREDCKRGHPGQ